MSFPRYPQYKDSGMSWVGRIPSHWSLVCLKRDVEFITSGARGWADNYADDGDLFIRIGNLTRDGIHLDLSDMQKVDVPESAEVSRTQVRAGDVLFSITAYLGSVAVVPKDLGRAFVSQHVALVRPRRALCLPEWIAYLTISCLGKTHLETAGYGGTKVQLSLADVTNLPLTTPPLSEQKLIIDFLDREIKKIDGLIGEQENLIALLKEKRQAVISHAVTRGLDPSVPVKDSGIDWIGEVPAHWKVTRLKFVAAVQTGVAKGKDNAGKDVVEVPYLRVANVQDGYLDLSEVATISIPEGDLDRYRLQKGDVLMNEGGDFDKLGRGHVWNGEVEPCIHQNHVFAVRPHGVMSDWLNLLTGSGYAQFFFMGRSKQATNLASISSTNVMELPVLVPPSNEQALLVEFSRRSADKFGELISEAESGIVLLKERRSALISAAVTGKIDVRRAAAAEAA